MKGVRANGVPYFTGALPREPTRGLIEGLSLRFSPHPHKSYFPENQLGASLKVGVPGGDRGALPDFPENQLGASLKANPS